MTDLAVDTRSGIPPVAPFDQQLRDRMAENVTAYAKRIARPPAAMAALAERDLLEALGFRDYPTNRLGATHK